jgi:general secretion pathway protein H
LRLSKVPNGFTLVELLIVMTIIGLMSAAVVLAMPGTRAGLREEAERFAARAQAAQERAVLEGRSVGVRVTGAGYGFDRRTRGEWTAMNVDPFVDRPWQPGTRAGTGAEAQRIVFDSIGMAEPVRLVLAREDEQVLVEVDAAGRVRVVS